MKLLIMSLFGKASQLVILLCSIIFSSYSILKSYLILYDCCYLLFAWFNHFVFYFRILILISILLVFQFKVNAVTLIMKFHWCFTQSMVLIKFVLIFKATFIVFDFKTWSLLNHAKYICNHFVGQATQYFCWQAVRLIV